MPHYTEVKAVIKTKSIGGVNTKTDCTSAHQLLDEALGVAFWEHGKEEMESLIAKTMERLVRYKEIFDKEQEKKK